MTEKVKTGNYLLESLNPSQRNAVLCTRGPVLILAGAGSGKTRVLTHRVAYLVEEKGVKPWNILAVTFTNKAAGEMKERILKLTKGLGRDIWIGTFHSICARILRTEGERLGFERNFLILDREDQLRFLKKVMDELHISQKQYGPQAVRSRISGAKNMFVSPDAFASSANDDFEETVALIYKQYQKNLSLNNSMDFDDLLINPIYLFQKFPRILENYQNRFKYILVDEYQDTNRTQYLFLKLLATKYRNLCVVGDDDQSIYKWRGADIRNILDFERDYPDCKIFHLDQNYRSTKIILNAAHSVVQNNLNRHAKKLWTEKEHGEKIALLEVFDAISEAQVAVDAIKEELSRFGRNFRDIAILYRTNAQSRVLEESLRRAGLPYVIVGGVRFYERKEIKDVLAYLRLICNPRDAISLRRIINYPLRGIGDASLQKLEAFSSEQNIPLLEAANRVEEVETITPNIRSNLTEFCQLIQKYAALKQEFSPGELARGLVDEISILKEFKKIGTTDALSRVDNVRELLSGIDLYFQSKEGATLDDFLEEVALITDIDTWNDETNAITLMTLHSAKGLEFPVVFITGLEEGLFPLSSSFNDPEELEEERRLFYVGTTRAKDQLYLSWAHQRSRFGENTYCVPSRFIKEVDEACIERKVVKRSYQAQFYQRTYKTSYEDQAESAPAYEDISQEMQELSVGCKVKHASFGEGKIISMEGRGENLKISVKFNQFGTKKLVVKYANLQILS